jgi:hypothetical protein
MKNKRPERSLGLMLVQHSTWTMDQFTRLLFISVDNRREWKPFSKEINLISIFFLGAICAAWTDDDDDEIWIFGSRNVRSFGTNEMKLMLFLRLADAMIIFSLWRILIY